ncbi:MAG: fibronectin type III domain-containing protein [Saprospirales bacterium]|nr:fibronectin type III domain-containing protein [Saprospirales bacterium]
MTSKPACTALAVFCLLATAFTARAQSTTYSITAKGLYDGNQVVVRWAPGDFDAWNWANQHGGYTLERTTYRQADTLLSAANMIASQVTLATGLAPVPEAQWQTMPDSNLAGIVAGSIYGDSLEVLDLGDNDFMSVLNATEARKNRFGFSLFACDQSLDIALAAGLAFVDTTAAADKEYIYIIRLDSVPSGVTEKKGVAMISTESGGTLPAPPKPKAKPGDHSVTLTWEKAALTEHYSSYILERSTDNGQTYTTVNSSPFVALNTLGPAEGPNAYLDSLADNTTTYVYRVRGLSPFGFVGPPSDTVRVKGEEPPLVVLAEITAVTEETPGQLQITWTFPAELESVTQKFEIYRAYLIDGEYAWVGEAGPSGRLFNDLNPASANYYVVRAKDINGKSTGSLPILGQINDETAPAAPVGLSGDCDNSGWVTVSWLPNAENDVLGYRVYIANQNTEDTAYVEVTSLPVRDTFFQFNVELNTLTEELYAVVRATDFRENLSEPSQSLNIHKADIVPPSPPSITKVVPAHKSVQLFITRSTSHDVQRYEIQLQSVASPGWSTIAEYQAASMVGEFTDSITYQDPLRRRRTWEYRVLAYDDADQVSSSQVIRTKALDQGIRDAIQNFTGMFSPVQKGVQLNWNYTPDIDLVGFQIYRAIDTSQLRSFKFIPATALTAVTGNNFGYLDTDMAIKTTFTKLTFVQPAATAGGTSTTFTASLVNQPVSKAANAVITLKYAVMAVFADGAQSPMSPTVSVQIQ